MNNKAICTCGVALGIFALTEHLCPVHYRDAFFAAQHPLHEEPELPLPAASYFVGSGVSSISANVYDHVTVADEANGVLRFGPARVTFPTADE